MSLHLGIRTLGLLLQTGAAAANRDDEIAVLGGTGAPSGSIYGGKELPAAQVAIAIRQDGTVDQLLNVTVDGGTNWETFLTGSYYASTAGAGAIGILDTAGYYTLTQVEGALTEIGTQIGGLTSTTYTFTEHNVLADNDYLYPALEKLDLKWGDLAAIGAGLGVTNIGLTTGSIAVGVLGVGAELALGGTAQGVAFGDGAGVVAVGTIQDVATGVTAAGADTSVDATGITAASADTASGTTGITAASADAASNTTGITAASADTASGTTGITAASAVTASDTTGITAASADAASNTTGITAASAVTASDTTGITAAPADTASSTATVTEGHVVPTAELWFNMAASGSNIIAQMAGDVDESTWASITQSPDLRTIQIDASGTWDGGDIGVTALWSDGTLEEKTLTATPGSVVQSAFGVVPASISRIRNLGSFSAGTVDVQTGRYPAIQTGSRVPTLVAFIEESTNGYDGAATINANGVITNTDAPNGALDFRAFYTLANALTDAGHVHVSGAITVTDGGHTHAAGAITVTDGGHVHTSGAITVTDGGHDHASGAITVTDGGHAHTSGAVTVTDGGHDHASGAITVTDGGHAHTSGAITVTDAGHDHAAGAITVTDPTHGHTIA